MGTMPIEELEKELADIEDSLFYINMVDRWTEEDSNRYSKLSRRKREIEEELRERRLEN